MTEEIKMLKEAMHEIISLRRQNELMKARLDMFDAMNTILHAHVSTQGHAMSPDLVQQIDRYLNSKRD